MNDLCLKPIMDDDIPLYAHWLQAEHVSKWYHHPEEWLREVRERAGAFRFIRHFIVYLGERPIGFCQYYKCSEAGEAWYGNISLAGTYSIDYLIGEESLLNRGFGKKIIELLIKEVFSLDDCERIIVQPELENAASCKALAANGFLFDAEDEIFCKCKR